MVENSNDKNLMITYAQIKQIHVLKNILGMDEDTYREKLHSFDVTTSKDLTEAEARVMIDALNYDIKQTKKNSHKKYEDFAGRDAKMATPAQLRKMEVVWKDICNDKTIKHREKTLREHLKRYKVDDIKFVTKKKAQGIISIMEKIKKHKFLKAI